MSAQFKVSKTTGINSDLFLQLIESAVWDVNTIYVKNTRRDVADPDKIRSMFYCIKTSDVQGLALQHAISNNFISIDERLKGDDLILHHVKIVKYDKDGFMKRHSDAKYMPEMAGRFIFIPPGSLNGCGFNNGVLTLHYNSMGFKVDDPIYQDSEKWTIVFLPYGLSHSVSRVTEGTRYSIVCDVSVKGVSNFSLPSSSSSSSDEEDDVGPGAWG